MILDRALRKIWSPSFVLFKDLQVIIDSGFFVVLRSYSCGRTTSTLNKQYITTSVDRPRSEINPVVCTWNLVS